MSTPDLGRANAAAAEISCLAPFTTTSRRERLVCGSTDVAAIVDVPRSELTERADVGDARSRVVLP
jgi:hypothetical protein